jgi:transposase
VSTDHTGAVPQTLVNEPRSLQHWLQSLPQGALIAVEATNPYHLPLADLATAAGHTVYVLNPPDVAHYL